MAGIDVQAIVHDLLQNGSRPVKLQTLTALWDRIFGKSKQDVSVSGGLVHAHTRDPFLASLPKDALEALARSYDDTLRFWQSMQRQSWISRRDGAGNQIESKPAIETAVVDATARFQADDSRAT